MCKLLSPGTLGRSIFFFTINEIFKEFQGGGVIVLDSTHSTSVASKIVSLCHFSAYVMSRIAPQNRQLVPDSTIRRSPYKIDHFRGIPKAFDAFFKVSTSSEHVRQKLVAVWSAPEKSAALSYLIGYLNFFPENLCVRRMANLCGAHM